MSHTVLIEELYEFYFSILLQSIQKGKKRSIYDMDSISVALRSLVICEG